MNQLEYLPGIAGQSVQLDGPSAFVGIAEEMRSREWDYDLGYRDLVTATRPARTVDVTFNADYETADTLRRVADADVMARTPGTFVAQKEWKQRGYILASDVDDIHYGRLSTGLKIALLDGAWWRLVKRSFVPEITTPEYRSATGETVTASGASGAPLHALTVEGKAVQDGTPTPNAPVEIRTVRGVNLLISDTSAWGVGSLDSGRYYTSARNQMIPAYGPDGSDYKIKIEPSETYTIRAWIESDTYTQVQCGYHQLKSDATFISDSGWQDVKNGRTFTTASNAAYLRVTFRTIPYNNTATADLLALMQEGKLRIMIQRGSSAPVYMPYGAIGVGVTHDGTETVTPIDLQGNVLASLPDGTKDVLTVDSAGAVTLEKRVGFVGTTRLAYYAQNPVVLTNYVRIPCGGHGGLNNIGASTASNFNQGYCNIAQFNGDGYSADTLHVYTNNSSLYLFAPKADKETWSATTAAEWITEHDVEAYYLLKTPQTIDLGTIDMPAIPFEAQISITAAVTPTITAEWQISLDAYLDYPHNYPYDFQATSSTADVTPSVLTPSDVYLAVFGPAVNPYVIVGGNRYQVNVTVPSGGYLVVDGRDKTIQLTLADGTVQNVFSSGVRGGGAGGGSYIFEKVPAGTSEVTYDGSFGFDLGWYEEEGEPPWSLS